MAATIAYLRDLDYLATRTSAALGTKPLAKAAGAGGEELAKPPPKGSGRGGKNGGTNGGEQAAAA